MSISDQNPISRGELAHVLYLLSGCVRDGMDWGDVAREIDETAHAVATGETAPRQTTEELLAQRVDALSELAALADGATLWRHGYKVIGGSVVELDEGEDPSSPPAELLQNR